MYSPCGFVNTNQCVSPLRPVGCPMLDDEVVLGSHVIEVAHLNWWRRALGLGMAEGQGRWHFSKAQLRLCHGLQSL